MRTLVDQLLGEYADWEAERQQLVADEEAGNFPSPGTWVDNDIAGIDCLRRIAEQLAGFHKIDLVAKVQERMS